MTERTAVRVVTRCPASTGGALINGALNSVMAKTMARVACLMITRVGGRKRNLGMSSSPPRFDLLENVFLVGH